MLMTKPTLVELDGRPGWRRGSRLGAGLAAILAVVVIAAVGWNYWSRPGTASVGYETKPFGLGTVEKSISATGAVKALVTVDVGSQLSGMIAEMKVDFNDPVKAGDLLAIIERAPFEAKAASSEANLTIAGAEVSQKEAALARVSARLGQAKRDLDRSEILAPKGYASHVQREQYDTRYREIIAELADVRAQLAAAKGTVALREADLAKARIDLGYTLIRSPINGVVIDRKLQPGQTVAAEYQTPVLFQLAQDLSQILIYAQVDEADIGMVKSGASAAFTVEAYPDETFEGRVDQVRLAAAKISGVVTYTVVIRAQNRDLRLFPDMTATVRIVGARRENVLAVPNDALRFKPASMGEPGVDKGGTGVLVLETDKSLQWRSVKLGLKGDAVTEIVGGDLGVGAPVIVRAKRATDQGKR